ncbi:MAG: arylamine N-acetyltransferase [Planctomycetota bacterium]
MPDNAKEEIRIADYFARVRYRGVPEANLATLQNLHLAHATHIPFENLEILLDRPILLDLPSLQRKLIDEKRGGYCFEQNQLFAAVLEELGFRVTRLAARVRYGTKRLLPRTHMLLKVDIDGRSYIADVGFGGEGLLEPIPLTSDKPAQQFAWEYRLLEEDGLWLLQSRQDGNWHDLYAFTLEPQHGVDYEVANYYVSTHPDSRFTQTLTVQRSATEARYILRNRELVVSKPGSSESRLIENDESLLDILRVQFGLAFPPGTRFRFKELPSENHQRTNP